MARIAGVSVYADAVTSPELQAEPVEYTATETGDGTGAIAAGTRYAAVTSADPAHLITLPPPAPGHVVQIAVGDNGFCLQTTDPETIAINGGAAEGALSEIAADTLVTCVCVAPDAWLCMEQDSEGAVTATAPAEAPEA
jgi:hypothetical protein